MKLGTALCVALLAGCGSREIPVVAGGTVACYDRTVPPSVVPPGFVPSFHFAGSVEIPADLRGTLDSSFVPETLIAVQGSADFQREDRQGKVVGVRYHFRGSIEAREYQAAAGLLPKNPTVQIEGRNGRGERLRISASLVHRGRLTTPGYGDDDYWKAWGEGK